MKNTFKILLLVISLVLMLSLSIAPAFAEETAAAEDAKNVLVETYTDESENIILVFEDGRKYNVTSKEWITDGVEDAKNALVDTYTDEEENVILLFEDGRKYNVTSNEWVVEREDKGMSISFSTENTVTSLNYMWQGMLCIFIVIGVIILFVYLLNFCSERAEVMKQIKEEQK